MPDSSLPAEQGSSEGRSFKKDSLTVLRFLGGACTGIFSLLGWLFVLLKVTSGVGAIGIPLIFIPYLGLLGGGIWYGKKTKIYSYVGGHVFGGIISVALVVVLVAFLKSLGPMC